MPHATSLTTSKPSPTHPTVPVTITITITINHRPLILLYSAHPTATASLPPYTAHDTTQYPMTHNTHTQTLKQTHTHHSPHTAHTNPFFQPWRVFSPLPTSPSQSMQNSTTSPRSFLLILNDRHSSFSSISFPTLPPLPDDDSPPPAAAALSRWNLFSALFTLHPRSLSGPLLTKLKKCSAAGL